MQVLAWTDAIFLVPAEELWVEIAAPILARLGHLDLDSVGRRVRVAADPGDLPEHALAGHPTRDLEAAVGDLGASEQRAVLADRCQLDPGVAVEGIKPGGQVDRRLALSVQRDDAVIDVLHVRALDEAVLEILVLRVQWVVDAEGTCRLRERSAYVDSAEEVAAV
jgi:hypothetical protein